MEAHILCYQISILASTPLGIPNSVQFSADLRPFQILRPFVKVLCFPDPHLFVDLFVCLFDIEKLIAHSFIVQLCTECSFSTLNYVMQTHTMT